jgi:3-methyladenine DNA glycosylase/8-oxoguanine DNA glycosylase
MKRWRELALQTEIDMAPTPPFDFDSTFHKPDHFTSGDNYWEPGVRWQTWYWQGQQLGLKFINQGTRSKPKMNVEVYHAGSLNAAFLDSLMEEVRYRYNLDLGLSDFYKVCGTDKILGPVIERWKGMRPGHPSSLYEYLIIGIVLQNVTVRRSIQMFQALLEHYGTLLEFDQKRLWCFWKPGALENVTEEDLRALKVGYRAKSIKKIDDYFAQGLVDEFKLRKRDRETQMNELLKLYGVGLATVEYLLFDTSFSRG